MSRFATSASIMLAAVLVALPPRDAGADTNQKDAGSAWRQTQDCNRDAFKKFPDYTPESNAKREDARRACLRDHKLPAPEGVVAVPQPNGNRQ